MTKASCVVTALVIAMAIARPTWADEATAGDKAAAEQLFRDGKKSMDRKDYAAACQAFQTSHELDPVVSTLANLANCRELNRQLASAWSLFLEAASKTQGDKKQASLHKTMAERAKKLEARLSYLTVSVPDESRVDGLVIVRNGTVMEEGLWNRAIPVDGGDYVIGGRAPGHEEWSTTMHVADEGGRVSVDVPKFKEATKMVEPVKEPEPQPEAQPVDEPEPLMTDVSAEPPRKFTTRRKLALGAGVVGIGGVALGAIFGSQMKGRRQDALDVCPGNPCARADEANVIREDAESLAMKANISLGVGAVAIVGAAVLWLTGAPETAEPSRTTLAPTLTPGYAGLDVAVRF